ncbi:MAG TPA: hypothetical protein VKB39_11540, partial [Candidatus Baltobacteraceae bacterium]|nr:hypothetical protein [Candidatus Baltobacteraceae bacterium]
MNMRTIGPSLTARAAALILTGSMIAGCSGNARLLPTAPGSAPAAMAPALSAPDTAFAPDRGAVETLVSMSIPRAGMRPSVHPSTISPLTHSVAIAVNAGKAHVFNATTASKGCVGGATGLTCTFSLGAPAGTDTFTVTTYSGVNGTGTALDRGISAKLPIKKGKANKVVVKLGPIVTNTANTGTGSLRYAVATAGAGDTITFLLPKGSTITLSSPILLTGNLTIAGPGANAVSISGGNAHQLFQIAGTATISGLTMSHAKAAVTSSPGGAIQNMGALTLASDVFGTNTSTVNIKRIRSRQPLLRVHGLHPHCTSTPAEGGAIYNDGALTITNTVFSGNAIKSDLVNCIQALGGAIYNDLEGTLSSTNDTYTGNAAAAGGAVYNAGVGAVTFTGDKFISNVGCTAATGCPTSGCGATSCTSFAVGEGAAIFDNGFGITVTSSTFSGNVAGGKTAGSQGQGGAIYLESQLPTITKSTFTGNLAGGGTSSCSSGGGGAIFATNALEIDNDTFQNNAATGDNTGGGGAVAGASTITGTGDTFTDNSVAATGGPCTANSQAIAGAVLSGTIATFTSSTFTGNSATGGEMAAGGALGGDNAIVTGCTFTSNSALATGSGGAASATGGGGALYVGSVVKISGNTFASNSATAQSAVATEAIGGAVVAGTSTVLSNNNTFTSNAAVLKTAGNTAGGGGIAVVSGTLVSTGDKFTGNKVTSSGQGAGGALFAVGGGLLTNDTMTSNKASGVIGAGGAMAFGSSASIIKHVIATGNSATGTTLGAGGALLDGGGSQLTDSQLSQNTASMLGGAVFATSNPEIVLDSTISNNTVTNAKSAGTGGAGIAALAGIEMSQVTISGNTVTVSGSGPAGGGGLLAAGILMIGSTVSGNKLLGSAPQS